MMIEVEIAKLIKARIAENGGSAVIAIDKNTVQHRIVKVRVHKGRLQGQGLNSLHWFNLAGYMLEVK